MEKSKRKINFKFYMLTERARKSNLDLHNFKNTFFSYVGDLKEKPTTPETVNTILIGKKHLKAKIITASEDLAEVGYFSGVNGIILPDAKEPYKISREDYFSVIYENFVGTLRLEEIAIKAILDLGLKPIIF